jgi:hypothetical protein
MRPLVSCTLLFVSVITVFIPKRAAKACGFYVSPGEYRFWLLQPDLTNQYDLTPFFFSSRYLYRGDMQLAQETYPEQNVEEWYKEINKKASKEDIDELLYDTDAHNYLNDQQSIAKRNSFMRFLLQPQNKELYRYMLLSKKMELRALNPDPWDEMELDKATFEGMKAEAIVLQQQAKTQFVKFRTAFQLVRMYTWRRQLDSAQTLYDKWIVPAKNNSWIKSAALYQIAINTWGLKRQYLLSKVFARGDYNRTPCLVFFDSKNIDSIVTLAKNEHERNVMYAMKAFNYAGRSLQYLQQIYNSEPGYKDMQFLLLREINKVEDWLLTTKVTSFEEPANHHIYYEDWKDSYRYHTAQNLANDKAYAHKLYQFILKIINDKKNQPASLLHLYAAHLCLVQKDYTCSQKHLNLAQASKLTDAKAQMQLRINRFLLQLENGFGASEEKELLSIVNIPDKATGFYDPDIMKDQLVLYTARKMIAKWNKAKGLMLLSKTKRALGSLPIGAYKSVYQELEEQATPAEYDEIIAILDKKNKTPFEKFISADGFRSSKGRYNYDEYQWEFDSWDRNKVLDAKSSWYIRNNMLVQSAATLKQIPDSFWNKPPYSTYIGGNAFYLNVYNSRSFDSQHQRSLNKRQVIEEMIYLQKLAEKDKSKAGLCYYQLANAWYNMSYYGNNWLMVRQWTSSSEMSEYSKATQVTSTPFNDAYYGCSRANQYYLKAMEATKDKKLDALCYFMANECNKRNKVYRDYLAGGDAEASYYYTKMKINYKDLNKNSIDAGYIEKLVNECELYQSFIKQYSRKL